jgi:hypothetical protein
MEELCCRRRHDGPEVQQLLPEVQQLPPEMEQLQTDAEQES